MATKKKGGEPSRWNIFHHLQEETTQTVLAIVFFVCALFLLLSAGGLAGMVGTSVYDGLSYLLGVGYYIVLLLFFVLSAAFFASLRRDLAWIQVIGALLFFVGALGLMDIAVEANAGIVGGFISQPLIALFDVYATVIFLLGTLCISLIIMFDASPRASFSYLWEWIRGLFGRPAREESGADIEPAISPESTDTSEKTDNTAHTQSGDATPEPKRSWFTASKTKSADKEKKEGSEEGFAPVFSSGASSYTPPSLSLLNRDQGKPGVGDIKAEANVIKRTLQNFGIDVEMDEVSIGPTVTRYALKPAEGVKLSRIVGLQNDLSLALAAHPLRIEAPIPGKSLVGIEIPNQKKTIVGLGTLLSSDEFQNSNKPLLIGIGKGISGANHYANIAKMPHILIAGATGAGKSVTIHALITSLLYRNSPETMKFIMVDPKRVELTLYNGIPHLLTPVITSAKNAILALKWLTKEMDRRYDVLEAEQVRDIESYHKNIVEPELKKQSKKTKKSKPSSDEDADDEDGIETMPYIVVIIDELADMMQTYPREMEAAVVRLAQMSRAVGIHLVLSTQRPSVNVITGLIKANIPARIALQVASQVDSRTILDGGGAEKLLGQGDMLYLTGETGKPQRIQSAFISEDEVKKVAKHIKENYEDKLNDHIDFAQEQRDTAGSSIADSMLGKDDEEEDDDLYEEAREIVITNKKASTSFLQRKLRVGYARAARLMDILEERGVVGPSEGSKGRPILVDNDGSNDTSEVATEPKNDETDISTGTGS